MESEKTDFETVKESQIKKTAIQRLWWDKRKFGAKEYFIFIISLFLIMDVIILLNSPFFRQIFGFLFLTFLPGLLIIQTLKLNKIEFTEKFVLSVGLSISFLMLFGLLINNLSLYVGYETPLATIPLLILFNIIFTILATIIYKKNKDKEYFLSIPSLSTTEKAFLIVPILFPALSIFGMHVMNTTDNNIILMFLLFLIPIYVVSICFFNRKFSKRLYPVVIFLISLSLLLLLSLRSNHLIGADTHSEYYLFQTTLSNLHWDIYGGYSALCACLSISLLPTIYQLILNLPSEFLYKIIHSLIYSVSPLVIYILSKKYVGEMYGFLASCFFMFQANFLFTAAHARANIAILFFALAMMALFSDKIDPLKKRILFIVFMASCMVSHYSTTYAFFFIMLGTFVGIEALSKKYTFKKVISLTTVVLFFSLIFFWYSQVTETAFNTGVTFVEETITNLNRFFVEESRAEELKYLVGQELPNPILSRVHLVLTWCTFILIGIGVLTMIKRYKEMITVSNIEREKTDFLKEKFEMEYFVFAFVCAGLLVIVVALPYVSIHYGIQRLYPLAIVILSVCFVIGGTTLANLSLKQTFKKHFFFSQKTLLLRKTLYGKFASQKTCAKRKSIDQNALQARACLIILLILIPYSMFETSAMGQLFGVSGSIILNSEGKEYDCLYVYDSESCGAKWLKSNAEKNIVIHTTGIGTYYLLSQGKIARGRFDNCLSSFLDHKKVEEGYIYLYYDSVVEGKLSNAHAYNITEYSDMFIGTNKIYGNGGSEVYKT